MNRRKTKTTIEIHQVYVIRQSAGLDSVFCPVCSTSLMVSPEEAAVLAEIPVRQIYRLVELGLIHYLEVEDSTLLICLHSISTTETTTTLKPVSGSGSPDCESNIQEVSLCKKV